MTPSFASSSRTSWLVKDSGTEDLTNIFIPQFWSITWPLPWRHTWFTWENGYHTFLLNDPIILNTPICQSENTFFLSNQDACFDECGVYCNSDVHFMAFFFLLSVCFGSSYSCRTKFVFFCVFLHVFAAYLFYSPVSTFFTKMSAFKLLAFVCVCLPYRLFLLFVCPFVCLFSEFYMFISVCYYQCVHCFASKRLSTHNSITFFLSFSGHFFFFLVCIFLEVQLHCCSFIIRFRFNQQETTALAHSKVTEHSAVRLVTGVAFKSFMISPK